jgi:hypothetical protein
MYERFYEQAKAAAGGKDPSFVELMENHLMQRTIWDKRFFRLTACEIFLSADKKMSCYTEDEDWPQSGRHSDGMLEWDGTGGNLTKYLAEYFSTTTRVHPELETRKVLGSPPRFIRMRYRGTNPDIEFYHDPWRFELPLRKHWAKKLGRRTIPYRCIAAVRLRNSAEDSDTVRLYHPHGDAFSPHGGAYPLTDEWIIGQDDREYMVYFVAHEERVPEDLSMAGIKTHDHPTQIKRLGVSGDMPTATGELLNSCGMLEAAYEEFDWTSDKSVYCDCASSSSDEDEETDEDEEMSETESVQGPDSDFGPLGFLRRHGNLRWASGF